MMDNRCYRSVSLKDKIKLREEIKKESPTDPIQRDVVNNLPNSGKKRKKNTHLKLSKKRKK